MKYYINEDYFNKIDSPEKAYWLGFIWCDGYVSKRTKGNYESYEFKLSLSSKDKDHLELFNMHLGSNIPIHYYDINNGFNTEHREARLMISRTNFAKNLYNNYGLVPNRNDITSFIYNIISSNYCYDFIRGVVDADGSIISRNIEYKSRDAEEFSLSIYTNEELLNFINEFFVEVGLVDKYYKLRKRHPDGDGNCAELRITGNIKVYDILHQLYNGSEKLSLKRKYDKYKHIEDYMLNYMFNFNRGEICKV